MTKVLKQLGNLFSLPFVVGLILSATMGILVFLFYGYHQDPEMVEEWPILGEMERLHNQSIDLRLRQRGPRPGSDDVAILTIDEKALEKYGRWPWPRARVAEVIEKVIDGGAKTIAFDIIFAEPQDATLNAISELESKLKRSLPGTSQQISREIEKARNDFNHDKILAATIEKHSDKLIMGAVFDEFTNKPFPKQDLCFSKVAEVNGAFDYWDNDGYLVGIHEPEYKIGMPGVWTDLLTQHLNSLQDDVSYNFILDNPQHPIVKALSGQDLGDQTSRAFTHLIRGREEAFDELDTDLEFFPSLNQIDKKDRSSLSTQMDNALERYCLSYLQAEDPLIPEYEKIWDQVMAEQPKLKAVGAEDLNSALHVFDLTLRNPIHHVDHWTFNIPEIRSVTEFSGTFNASQDKDGSIRRARMFTRNGDMVVPTLAFKTFLVANKLFPTAFMQANPNEWTLQSSIVTQIEMKDEDNKLALVIPTDHKGQLMINYAGPQKMFAYLSAAEVLSGEEEIEIEQRQLIDDEWIIVPKKVNRKEFLSGKNFIFGATATGIYDLRVTPFEENFPGVETHANLLDNLIRQDYLKTSSREQSYMPWIVFLLGLLFSFVVAHFGAITGFLVSLAILTGIVAADALFFFPQGTVVVILFPLTTVAFLYTSLTFLKYLTEERKKQQLKGTFQKYVSPEIVEEILKDPSKLELGGIKQEMSVFFSDIRGFTTISEQLDAQELSDLLNSYLTPMTDIVFKNSGTLDKYMGDAIMAFFGAPIPYKDHAAQACRAALQQIDKLFELQKEYEEKGLPIIDIGIGINTGEMSVGNMGSETVRNYTVMGDSVNLGSRLEGINKQYGTRIIISEFTKDQIKDDDFVYREIDWVKVKGKNEPVKIFELVAEGPISEAKSQQLSHFNSGFALYHQKQWEGAIAQFEEALTHDADDQTSQLYIKRCLDYMTEPPGDDWDGVFTMTTK